MRHLFYDKRVFCFAWNLFCVFMLLYFPYSSLLQWHWVSKCNSVIDYLTLRDMSMPNRHQTNTKHNKAHNVCILIDSRLHHVTFAYQISRLVIQFKSQQSMDKYLHGFLCVATNVNGSLSKLTVKSDIYVYLHPILHVDKAMYLTIHIYIYIYRERERERERIPREMPQPPTPNPPTPQPVLMQRTILVYQGETYRKVSHTHNPLQLDK